MDFCVLGPLEVTNDDGGVVPVPSGQSLDNVVLAA
jgi:hypothetical protein